MKSKSLFLLLFCGTILGVDQLTKFWVDRSLSVGEHHPVLPGLFDLVHYRNPGAAFSLFADWHSPVRGYFFFAMSVAALAFLVYYLVKTPLEEKKTLIPLGLILSGALGNLIDRAFRGTVVDFLLFHWYDKVVSFEIFGKVHRVELIWPAFNVADSAITLGVIGLFLSMLKKRPEENRGPSAVNRGS